MEATANAGIDIKKVDEYLNDSMLLAVKYIKEQTGWNLTDCKRWVDNYRNKKIYGTITWFEIAKDGYPPVKSKNDIAQYSDAVLVTDRKSIDSTNFAYALDGNPIQWCGYNVRTFTPTHWAFINYPT